MFGRKPAPFKPYPLGTKKPKRRLPRWLLWLLIGVILGGLGVIFVQQEYMPPRLSAQESARLADAHAQVSLALQQTRAELDQTREALAVQRTQTESLTKSLESARASLKPLQDDLSLLREVLPPDPRGGALQIRAARFFNEQGSLDYHVVLTRQEGSRPFRGQVQFAVEGRYPSGRTGNVVLDAIPLDMGDYQNVHGRIALPEGMLARQITVRVLDRGDRMHAMRVINSRN